MSELYLVLRHRLEDVAVDWVAIPSPVLKRARKRQGYSYETLARHLNVVAKTWERYEKAGRVPRQMLPRVAEVLQLEIEEAEPQRVTVPANGDFRAELAALRSRTEDLYNLVLERFPVRAEGRSPEEPT